MLGPHRPTRLRRRTPTLALTTQPIRGVLFSTSSNSCLGSSLFPPINLIEPAARPPRPGRCPVTEILDFLKIPVKHI